MAVKRNVLIGGDDFKSGQTKLKSVLVDYLVRQWGHGGLGVHGLVRGCARASLWGMGVGRGCGASMWGIAVGHRSGAWVAMSVRAGG